MTSLAVAHGPGDTGEDARHGVLEAHHETLQDGPVVGQLILPDHNSRMFCAFLDPHSLLPSLPVSLMHSSQPFYSFPSSCAFVFTAALNHQDQMTALRTLAGMNWRQGDNVEATQTQSWTLAIIITRERRDVLTLWRRAFRHKLV